MKITRRNIITIVLASALALAFLWVRSYLFDTLATDLQQRLASVKISGFNLHYDSISVDWLRNAVEIQNVVLEKNVYDTTCIYPEYISIKRVRAEGIGLLKLIFQKILVLDGIYLDSPRISMRENSLLMLDSASSRENEFTLLVTRVEAGSLELNFTDSASCRLMTAVKTNISLRDLAMDFHVDKPFTYSASVVTINRTDVVLPEKHYSLQMLRATMNFAGGGFRADSIHLIPALSKTQFGKTIGHEVDRFDCIIPFVKADGISFSAGERMRVAAPMAEIQFYLKVFRDKRLPFLRKKKLLPQQQLQNLPFDLHLDSLKVTKSYVLYEEYAEKSSEPGSIFFDNLYAVFRNINSEAKTGSIELSAKSDLLGQGDLIVYANLPMEAGKRSTVAGTIKNFNIPEINSMLTPNTQIKVESGDLKELSFNFAHNSERSDGEITLNYENLKLVTYKEEATADGEEPQKDNLKTFILNAFVFRKNMHEDLPEDKRTGTILYVRDDTRSIFNFWSKSLVSGIKSAYKLDKAEAKILEREAKKEERLSRKEARRSKRSAKKNERG